MCASVEGKESHWNICYELFYFSTKISFVRQVFHYFVLSLEGSPNEARRETLEKSMQLCCIICGQYVSTEQFIHARTYTNMRCIWPRSTSSTFNPIFQGNAFSIHQHTTTCTIPHHLSDDVRIYCECMSLCVNVCVCVDTSMNLKLCTHTCTLTM